MRRTPVLFVVVLVAGSLLLAGCGSGNSSGSSSSKASIAKGMFQHLTPLERTILSTTPIPFSQYDLAIQASVSCLRVHGFTVSEPELNSNGLLGFNTSFSFGHANDLTYRPTAKENNRVLGEDATCQSESAAVQAAYIYEHQSSVQQIDAGYGKMVRCYESLGLRANGKTISGIGNLTALAQRAVSENVITAGQSSACEALFQAVDVQPLPGIANLLQQLAKSS